MARNSPVAIWMIRHRPSRDPKFQKIEMLDGVGRSIITPLIILKSGCLFRRGVVIE